MQVVLVMFRTDGQRRSFSITRDMTVIGRREDCQLRIPLSEVSRKHCRVLVEPGQVRVQDLGSSNGTWVNGQRVQDVILNPGDSLQVGPVVFVVQIDGEPVDDELQPITREEVQAALAAAAPGEEQAEEPVGSLDAGDFDPMEALGGPSEESVFDLEAESEMAEAAAALQKQAAEDLPLTGDHDESAAPINLAADLGEPALADASALPDLPEDLGEPLSEQGDQALPAVEPDLLDDLPDAPTKPPQPRAPRESAHEDPIPINLADDDDPLPLAPDDEPAAHLQESKRDQNP